MKNVVPELCHCDDVGIGCGQYKVGSRAYWHHGHRTLLPDPWAQHEGVLTERRSPAISAILVNSQGEALVSTLGLPAFSVELNYSIVI